MRLTAPITAVILAGALALPLAGAPAAWARGGGTAKEVRAIDTNNDGVIDLQEAQATGGATFDKLDADKDGGLTTKELQGRVSRKDLKAADGSNDGKLDKQEYTALIEQRFKAADTGNDGKLDAKEMKTSAGRSLLQLLK